MGATVDALVTHTAADADDDDADGDGDGKCGGNEYYRRRQVAEIVERHLSLPGAGPGAGPEAGAGAGRRSAADVTLLAGDLNSPPSTDRGERWLWWWWWVFPQFEAQFWLSEEEILNNLGPFGAECFEQFGPFGAECFEQFGPFGAEY